MTQQGILRTLKGAPLSVMLALWLYGPAGRDELVVSTGYSINAVSQALTLLEEHLRYIERAHYRQWRLVSAANTQLPFPLFPLAEGSLSDPSAHYQTNATVDNPVDNHVAPATRHAERSLADPSTPPPVLPPQFIQEREGSLSDLSETEGSLSDLSDSGSLGMGGWRDNNISLGKPPTHTTPIEADQTGAADPQLLAVCRSLGINGRARELLAGSHFIQARGPEYIRLHVSQAAKDPARRGDARGLAIHRMYGLQPALPCGDCGKCQECSRRYPDYYSAESGYAGYADVIRR